MSVVALVKKVNQVIPFCHAQFNLLNPQDGVLTISYLAINDDTQDTPVLQITFKVRESKKNFEGSI